MSNAEWWFLSAGLLGFAVLLISLFLGHHGDMDAPAHADLDSDAIIGDIYTPSWRSIPVIAASVAGFGTGSFLSAYGGFPTIAAVLMGLLVMFGLGSVVLLLAQWMSRQQSNSTLSSESYIGAEGKLLLDVPANGFGQVAFHDRNNEFVSLVARSANEQALPSGMHVLIIGVANDGVIVSPHPHYLLED